MTPGRVLGFLLAVMAVLALIGELIPQGGVKLGALDIDFPSAREVVRSWLQKEPELVDITDILAVPTDSTEAPADSLAIDSLQVDSAGAPLLFDPIKLAPLEERIKMHYPAEGAQALHGFFAALESAGSRSKPIRILHYGDSQLEGDRITAYVRNKLQTQFGGNGPGLVAVADIVPHFSVDRRISDNWIRYSAMGKRPKDLTHERFGAMSAFSRFTPILNDTIAPDTLVHTATITLRPERRCFAKAQVWSECRLFYGWHRALITLTMTVDDVQVSSETIEPGAQLLVREWRFEGTPKEVMITMKGTDSPDVFGVSLEGRNGVAMDNIPARGAAGYEFRRSDQALLARMYNELDVELLILQYGGNVLPNLKSAEEAAQYGRFFGAQISRFRKMMPGVSIIVIGPSDMSIKEGDAYVTRPYLEDVRNAMKTNALAQGAVFWDMYEAMGGKNSMASWVQADPPLAATDYTHFSPQGARKVGELFYNAVITDFAAYHAARQ